MVEKEYKVSGMSCNHCVMAIKKELSVLQLNSFDVQIGTVKVKFEEEKVTSELIEKAVLEAGYQVVK